MKLKKLKHKLTTTYYALKFKVSYIAYFQSIWKENNTDLKGFCVDTPDVLTAKTFKSLEEANKFRIDNRLFSYEVVQIEK